MFFVMKAHLKNIDYVSGHTKEQFLDLFQVLQIKISKQIHQKQAYYIFGNDNQG